MAMSFLRRSRGMNAWGAPLCACAVFLVLSGCAGPHDPDLNLSRGDYRSITSPTDAAREAAKKAPPPIPALAPSIASPEMPLLTPNRTVTLSVSGDLPLKDVLFELARQAEVDIEIDPRIEGGVDFSAHNRPFLDVIDRMCDLAGLRFRIRNNVVRVEIDEPYTANYEVPYLSVVRQTKSNIGISTDVVTPGGGSTSGGDTTSTASISGESDADFFGEMATGLKAILANTSPAGLSVNRPADQPAVVIHKQTGIISVFGTLKQQQAVADYLRPLIEASMAQVQIDARIIEVNLDDRYKSGIDWTTVMQQGTIYSLNTSLNNFNDPNPLANTFQATIDGSDVDLLVNLIEKFGTTRTLSSPRTTVLNNQAAILKVASNYVYFDVQVDRETQDSTSTTTLPLLTVSSDIRTIPIGLVMAVQPSVDLSTNDIVLTVRPTVTELDSTVADPAVQYINSTLDPNAVRVESQIPVVRVREIDSVLRLQSGEIAVLGGLMQDKSVLDDEGLPGVGEMPVVGDALTKREKLRTTTEMVILLRAQVLKSASATLSEADRHLYKTFIRDPRPLSL